MVAASRVVRAVHVAVPGSLAPPVGPACGGALLAWALAGNLPMLREHTGVLAAGLGAAAPSLALLLPRGAAFALGCRARLVDCALPIDALTSWRQPADWPGLLATGAPLAAMLLHHPVQGGQLGAVTLVVERGAVWRPPGLSAHGLHAGLARW